MGGRLKRIQRICILSILIAIVATACGDPQIAVQTASSDSGPPQPFLLETPSGPSLLIATVPPTPTPTLTPTPIPRPRLDTPGADIAPLHRLGLGLPWLVVWSPNGTAFWVFSPGGGVLFEQQGAEWTDTQSAGNILVNITPRPVGTSPDGRLLAYQEDDNRIVIWDLDSQLAIQRTDALPNVASRIDVSQDGTLVGALLNDIGVYLYEVETGERMGTLRDRNATGFRMSTTEPEAITSSMFVTYLWDLTNQQVIRSWPARHGSAAFVDQERALCIAEDHFSLLRENLSITTHNLPETLDYYLGYRVSSTGDHIALFGQAINAVQILNTWTGEVERWIDTTQPLLHFSFSHDDQRGIAITQTGKLISVDINSGTTHSIHTPIYSGPISDLAFSPTQPILAVAAGGWPIRVWHKDTGTLLNEIPLNGTQIAFSPNGSNLAILEDNLITIWDIEMNEELRSYRHSTTPDGMIFRDDSQLMVYGPGEFVIWDINDGNVINRVPLAHGYARIRVSSHGDRILVHSYPNLLDIYDGEQGHFLGTFELTGDLLAVSPDSSEVAGRIEEFLIQEVALWDLETGERLRSFEVPFFPYIAEYSSDGTILAVSSVDDFPIPFVDGAYWPYRWAWQQGLALTRPLNREVFLAITDLGVDATALAIDDANALFAFGTMDGRVELWGVEG